MTLNKFYFYFLTFILILLSACTSQVQTQSSPVEPVAATQTLDPPEPPTPTVQSASATTLPKAVSPIVLEHPYALAAFSEGPFDFEIFLYQDPGFSQNPTMTWMYSDIPGVGTRVSWIYHGTGINDPVAESWGICPDISPRTIVSGVKDGDNSIREGGILLPPNAAPGSLVQYVFKLETSQGTYGGVLSFLLAQGIQWLEPSKVTIYGFDQPLQASGCIAEFQSSFMPQSTSTAEASFVITVTPPFPSGLNVEEQALENVPQVEPLTFVPLQGMHHSDGVK